MDTQEIIKNMMAEVSKLRAANEKTMGIIAHRNVNYWGNTMPDEKKALIAELEENNRKIDLYSTAILALRKI